jgi:hypothetical protein
MIDSRAIENFIVLEATASVKLRNLKKPVPYRLYFADR